MIRKKRPFFSRCQGNSEQVLRCAEIHLHYLIRATHQPDELFRILNTLASASKPAVSASLPKWIRWCLEWFVGVDRAVLPEGWWWPSTVSGMGE